MLGARLLVENPFLPASTAVLHTAQDDLGHLQAGLAQSDYVDRISSSCTGQILSIAELRKKLRDY